MKLLFVLSLMLLGFSPGPAQQVSKLEQFRKFSTDEALYLYRDTGEPPELKTEMTRSVFSDQRMDLIQLIFKDHGNFYNLIEASREIEDSSLKDRIVILLLRSESPFWYRPPPQPESDLSRGVQFENLVEPFTGVLGKYFPTMSLSEEIFATKEKRDKLATELEDAMRRPKGATQRERPPKRSLKSEEKPLLEIEGKAIPSSANEPSRSPERQRQWWPWGLILVALVGIGGILWGKWASN